jgi:hypothetical protein
MFGVGCSMFDVSFFPVPQLSTLNPQPASRHLPLATRHTLAQLYQVFRVGAKAEG